MYYDYYFSVLIWLRVIGVSVEIVILWVNVGGVGVVKGDILVDGIRNIFIKCWDLDGKEFVCV